MEKKQRKLFKLLAHQRNNKKKYFLNNKKFRWGSQLFKNLNTAQKGCKLKLHVL